MSLMVHAAINNPGRVISDIIVTDTPIEVPTDSIAVYALANVLLHRQLEITNGWRALINFIRDRALLDRLNTDSPPGFNGFRVYSGQHIDFMGEGGDRRTSSDIAFFGADDIAVGIGAAVTGVPAAGLVTPIFAGFTKLIEQAHEQTLKAA